MPFLQVNQQRRSTQKIEIENKPQLPQTDRYNALDHALMSYTKVDAQCDKLAN